MFHGSRCFTGRFFKKATLAAGGKGNKENGTGNKDFIPVYRKIEK
jgi:hypothetical protein